MSDDTPAPRIVKLQINTAGAWRDVITFDVENEDQVLHHAPNLVGCSPHFDKVTLRVIIPGDTKPLLNWSHEHGWREWDTGAAR